MIQEDPLVHHPRRFKKTPSTWRWHIHGSALVVESPVWIFAPSLRLPPRVRDGVDEHPRRRRCAPASAPSTHLSLVRVVVRANLSRSPASASARLGPARPARDVSRRRVPLRRESRAVSARRRSRASITRRSRVDRASASSSSPARAREAVPLGEMLESRPINRRVP